MEMIMKEKNEDIIISDTIIFHIFYMACKNMLVSNSKLLFSYNGILNNISIILIFFVYLRMIWLLKGRINVPKNTILVICFILLFCLVTAIIDPVRFISDIFPYNYVKIQGTTFLIYCFPLFFTTTLLHSTDYIVNRMYNLAFVLFIGATAAFFFKVVDNLNMYSMSYGYNALWCFVIYCFRLKKERRPILLIPIICTLLYILIGGSRGPLLCIAATVLVILFDMELSIKKAIISSVIIILILLLYFNFDQIIDFLVKLLDSINVSSRTLVVLKNGNISYSDDRVVYHQGIINALKDNPLMGLGAFGGEATVGLAHSLYLDIFANFGYLFGSVYLVFILGYIIWIHIKERKSSMVYFIDILVCLSFPIGFVDSEFWISKELWMIMGALIVYKKQNASMNNEYTATENKEISF